MMNGLLLFMIFVYVWEMRKLQLLIVFMAFCIVVSAQQNDQKKEAWLMRQMMTRPEQFSTILKQKDSLNIQIIYTRIDRDKHNKPSFTEYTFNLNNDHYFYPASTVKMPVALLALEKQHILKVAGLDRNTTMITEGNSPTEPIIYTEPKSENSKPSLADYVKQIFLVSDNDAFNRLYEWMGQAAIQQKLTEKGYPDAIIRHRLQISLTDEQNRLTNPISFYDSTGKLVYHQDQQFSQAVYPKRNVHEGIGYYKGSQLINEPFDFSLKNRIYLQDLTHILRSFLFPQNIDSAHRFNLGEEDRKFALHWLSAYPGESSYPQYDTAHYWDAYCKFLMYGCAKGKLPGNIRIFNKVGDAYGYLTDIAYIIDPVNNVEFMLSATIYCNSDGIFNDDKYDYETVGYPFMKNLGQLIYDYERTRKRKHQPDLSEFIIDYQNNK